MRRILILSLAISALLLPAEAVGAKKAAAADGQVIRDWTGLAFAAVRDAKASDAAAARAYAMVDAAMYDAVNATQKSPGWSAIVAAGKPQHADPALAAAVAAHDVLSSLYPNLQSSYDAQLDDDRALASGGAAKHAETWGAEVADRVLAARANDGSSPATTHPPVLEVGKFRGTMGGTQYANLQPFAIADASVYATATPPPLDSREYASSYNEVKSGGDASIDDPAAKATFDYWALSGGTSQPAGAWLQVASVVSQARDLSLADTARLFALEAMAMADTVAPTYRVKLDNYSWRPATAINEGDLDGNPATDKQTFWAARGGNASSPEFWSGHSSFSAAGAAVLAGFFCDDAIPFTLTVTTANGTQLSRSYTSFTEAANEAGYSRILGGLHFPFSNTAGTAAGRAVAAEVLQREPAC